MNKTCTLVFQSASVPGRRYTEYQHSRKPMNVTCKLIMSIKPSIILTFIVVASCHSSADKTTQTKTQLPDTSTTIVDESTEKSSPDTTNGTFVATLKDGKEPTNATINDSTIFNVKKGDRFIYENDSHNAWTADGRFGYIPPEDVVKVDTPYFKFNFSKWNFAKDSEYELAQAATKADVDLNSLIQQIRNKNSDALKTFFNLRDKVDGAAAEEYESDFWAMINIWSDGELAAFTQSLGKTDKKDFASLLLDNEFLSNMTSYYQLYYPKTLKEIKAIE